MDPKSSITRAESDFLMVLDDSTQRLERDFRKIERRFVMKVLNEEGDVNSIWTHYSSRVRYYDMGLWLRVEWFRSKGEVIEMEQRVDRITARKISHQLHIALGAVHDMERSIQHTYDGDSEAVDRLRDKKEDGQGTFRRRN